MGFTSSVVPINADRDRQIAPIWLCMQNSRPFNVLNISYYCLQWRRWCSLPATYRNRFLGIWFYLNQLQLRIGSVYVCVLFQKLEQLGIFAKTNTHTYSADHILTTVTMSYNPSGFWILQSFITLKQIYNHILFKWNLKLVSSVLISFSLFLNSFTSLPITFFTLVLCFHFIMH